MKQAGRWTEGRPGAVAWPPSWHDRGRRGGMEALDSFLDAVGQTPLVRLSRVARGVRPTLLAKLEMLNPGGSVKDRIALPMIAAAERTGLLKAGGTIVEPTSGNTGHGLAIVAAIKGYKCIFVMPDKMSQEKVALLRAYGAEVIITPTAVPPESPESYYRVADRLTEEILGADGGKDRRPGCRRRDRRHHHGRGPLPEGAEAIPHGGRRRPRGLAVLGS